jgi:hypothetical protein
MRNPARLILGLLAASAILASGCWRQPVVPNVLQDQYVWENHAINGEYPGTRELMNAPSNDPALGEQTSGNLTRP